jgi:hypothetical protein
MEFWWGGVWILPERWMQQLQVKDYKKASCIPEVTVQQCSLQGTPMASMAPTWKEIISKYISITYLVGMITDWIPFQINRRRAGLEFFLKLFLSKFTFSCVVPTRLHILFHYKKIGNFNLLFKKEYRITQLSSPNKPPNWKKRKQQ